MPTEIPNPPAWPVIGNTLDLLESDSTAKLLARYGSIVKVNLGVGKANRISIGSVELLNEVCDENRFVKKASAGGLVQVRNLTGDGLFTARHDEENWGLAHRILAPILGPMMIGDMFEDMHDVACQLIMKWARLDQRTPIDVTDDFTRLTLDTLALCAMDTRFNSFYTETPHSFVEAMSSFLGECGNRMLRPSFVPESIFQTQNRKYHEDMDLMRHIANQVIERRKATSTRKRDLVDAMLYEQDPKTGKSLPHDNVVKNMITFLIAGHETTSGLLSFIIYCLAKHPAAMTKARDEISSVIGSGVITSESVSKLPYISAVIRETLRLYPTAPGFTVQPKSSDPKDYPIHIGKEQYIIRMGESIAVSLPAVHRDPTVYGDDAETFRPERMLDTEFNKLPKNAWKPFGNGARGCIGRAFALQEAMIVIALLLQNFDFELADPDYQLSIQKTLTIKPKGLQIHVRLRDGLTPSELQRRLLGGKAPARRTAPAASQKAGTVLGSSQSQELLICYGSNMGTCQALAHTLSRDATVHGFNATVFPMDQVQPHQITPSIPIVIVTASYEGQPPDNAGVFVKWLQGLTESPLAGVHHAVYGCGNRDWTDTFQHIPTLVDDIFKRCGSTPLVKRGTSDAADGNIANEFDAWADAELWPALKSRYRPDKSATHTAGSHNKIEILQTSKDRNDLPGGTTAIVEENHVLTAPGEPEKRHIRIRFSSKNNYQVGDHIAVLPANHDATVKQVMNRFGLAHDTKFVTPTGNEHSVYTHLRDSVEINHVVTDKNLRAILASVPQGDTNDLAKNMITHKGRSAIEILRRLPTATLPFEDYLSMLPPIRPRYYSISSSPLADPQICTLTYSVLENAVTEPDGTGYTFRGACSTFLAEMRTNDRLYVSVRSNPGDFHLPQDPDVPIVMVCAGSGLAPFMGFVKERVHLQASGVKPAPAMLFIGCRHPDRDMLYAAQLHDLARSSNTTIYYAFSRAASRSEGCKYVQDRLLKEGEKVLATIESNGDKGKLFVCGDTRVLEGVTAAMKQAYAQVKRSDAETVDRWWDSFRLNGEKFSSEFFD